MTMRFRSLAALAVVLGTLSGCGGGSDLVPVSGIVTLNGQPLEGATVVFTPAAGTADATTAIDTTGPEGNYRLMTRGQTGVTPGKYTVLVSKEIVPDTGSDSDQFVMVDEDGNVIGEDPYMAQAAIETMGQGGGSEAAVETTKVEETFERDVPPGGTTLDFDLKATEEEAKILRGS